jgi:hypothetical protein
MKEIDAALVELAARQHQVFSRMQAREAGVSASSLSRRVASGRLIVCGTSALHLPGATLTYRGRLMAGLLDLGREALVSGRAAANLHGLDGFNEGPIEFLVPRPLRSRTTAGNVTSTGSRIVPLDRVVIDCLACTSATRTIVELLANATPDEAGDALASATRRRLTAPAVVSRRLDELGRNGRTGVRALDESLPKVVSRAASSDSSSGSSPAQGCRLHHSRSAISSPVLEWPELTSSSPRTPSSSRSADAAGT